MSAGPAPTAAAPRPPGRPRFGVCARFGEVFALVFVGRPGVFLGLGALVVFGAATVGVAAAWYAATAALRPAGIGQDAASLAPVVAGPLLALAVLVGAGAMVVAGCDWREGRRRGLGFYLGRTLRRLHVAGPLGALVLALVLLGGSVIGLVGLWIAAVFSAVPAALLWEDARWGALRRSRELTRGYRWPIAGLLLMVLLVPFALYIVAVIVGAPQAPGAQRALSAFLGALAMLLTLPLWSATSAVVHGRLRALKGEADADDLRAVFG